MVVGHDETSKGSISGTIEVINFHNKRRFWLYPIIGPPRVNGTFRNELRRQFTDAVDKYVTVYGTLTYKHRDKFPYAIEAEHIEIHDPDGPTLRDLKGVSPNATGALTTQEFIDVIRDDW